MNRLEEGAVDDEDLFERGESDLEVSKEDRVRELEASKKANDLERAAKRNVKYMENGDLDVDDI